MAEERTNTLHKERTTYTTTYIHQYRHTHINKRQT